MARTREFDTGDVLDKAMHLFWRQGYESTSIHDLVAATGINRASMYNSFGSKEGIFLAAIDRYVDQVTRDRLALLSQEGSAREAIERYFDALIAFSVDEGPHLGCLLTNSAVEMAPRNPQIEAKLFTVFGRAEKALRDAVKRGQAQGEISRDQGPTALARFLMSMVHGLRVLARFNPDKKQLRDAAKVALSVLD